MTKVEIDKDLKWDLIKMEIGGFKAKYAKTKAKTGKNEKKDTKIK